MSIKSYMASALASGSNTPCIERATLSTDGTDRTVGEPGPNKAAQQHTTFYGAQARLHDTAMHATCPNTHAKNVGHARCE